MAQWKLKKRLKTENNFTIYETVQHNKCAICSKLIISQFLSTLEVRKSGWMCPATWILDFTHPSIRIDCKSPPQSPQAALRVAEHVPTAIMSKKI